MLRAWPWWISLILTAVSLGWFWMLSLDLRFVRVEPDTRAAAAEVKK
ncbi:MAG: hypothetical protein ACAI34_20605 [Verrucomicrobium sp.]|nr:hypothetical protein [Verrucomicrobium sp.]